MGSKLAPLALLLALPFGGTDAGATTPGRAAAWECIDGRGAFSNYAAAMAAVRQKYRAEGADTSRSSWVTSAEYFDAGGCGYLILGMNGRPYIFAGVPRVVWDGFRTAPSIGTYYNRFIKGRYRFRL